MPYATDATRIVAAIDACGRNSIALVAAASQLLKGGFHAPALSLAVLSLEEVGKVCIIDGLALAKQGDSRADFVKRSKGSHERKLLALDFYPPFLRSIALLDPRFGSEDRYLRTLEICIEQYRSLRQALSPWLGNACSLADLDPFKQRGFYVNISGTTFVAPADDIDPVLSEKVVRVADRIADALQFFLKGNLERYEQRILAWRGVSSVQLAEVRKVAELIATNVFGLETPAH